MCIVEAASGKGYSFPSVQNVSVFHNSPQVQITAPIPQLDTLPCPTKAPSLHTVMIPLSGSEQHICLS